MRREPGTGIEIGLLAILSFGVLAYGSTSYWARAILQALTAVLFVCWWLSAARSRLPVEFEQETNVEALELGGVRFRASGLGILAVLFVGCVFLQLIPIPSSLRNILAPQSINLERPPGEVLSLAELGSTGQPWRSLSMAPGLTLDGLLQFLAYVALFVVAYNLCDSRERILRVARYLVILGFVVGLIGLLQQLSGTYKVYGIKVLRHGGQPYGPFVNHNHFAGFMELVIPLAFALLLRRLLRRGGRSRGWRIASNGVSLPGTELRGERSGQAVLLALALAVMGSALVLSMSRGGVLALAVSSMTVTGLLLARGGLGRRELVALVLVIAASTVLFVWIGPDQVIEHYRGLERVEDETSLRGRMLVWKATVGLIADFPILGSGLATYPVAFLPYYPLGAVSTWKQAHNDYLQFLAEMGAAGGLIGGIGLLLVLVRLLQPLIGRTVVREHFLYYGFCTSILSLFLHSLVDFNLHIPGNASVLVVLLALALAQRSILQSGPATKRER